MKIIKQYTAEELLIISTEEFNDWKGLTLHILKKDGTEFTDVLLNLELASISHPPQLVSRFIFADNISVPILSIKVVYLYE